MQIIDIIMHIVGFLTSTWTKADVTNQSSEWTIDILIKAMGL